MDYQKLSESFLDNAKKNNKALRFFLNEKVKKIEKQGELWKVITNKREMSTKTLIVTAGAHSLLMAKKLGYGEDYSLLSVAGSFYFAPESLNGKVYTMQIEKLPFAAIHGDPEVHNAKKTRFGPTAKVLPMLERHNYASVYEYFQTAGIDFAAIRSFLKILSDKTFFSYILTQFIYDLPILGKILFIKEVKKIVPNIKLSELKIAKGYGGVRPQIVNKKTRTLDLGEAKIKEDRVIFNITPSPGASTCLRNAEEEAKIIVDWLGEKFEFKQKLFRRDLVE